jgi:Helix-turn-helix
MDTTEGPTLAPEVNEQLQVQLHYIQKKYHDILLPFVRDLPPLFPFAADAGLPDPPAQPIAVLKHLGDYATELFRMELSFYPQRDPSLPLWKKNLAKAVEQKIIKHAARIAQPSEGSAILFKKTQNLTYHVSVDKMREHICATLNTLLEAGADSADAVDLAVSRAKMLGASGKRSAKVPPDPITPVSGRMQWKNEGVPPLKETTSTAPEGKVPIKPDAGDAKVRRLAFAQPKLDSLGMTPSGWAKKAGLHPSIVYDYLNGQSRPRPQTIRDLAEALGVKSSDLPK